MNTQSAHRSSAFLTVDLEIDGKQFGHINIPQSPNNDAWGVQQVPIAVIKNGTGSTLILTGGNHGDKYEGPVTISELARNLDPARIFRQIDPDPNHEQFCDTGRTTSISIGWVEFESNLSRRSLWVDY